MAERRRSNENHLSGTEAEPPEPEYDIEALHAPIMREPVEPTEGREPLPVGLIFLFFVLIGWGGWYLGRYSANFDPSVLPSARLGEARPTGPEKPAEKEAASGPRTYNFCTACHQADGRGVPGQYPPLAGSERLMGPAELSIRIVLDGFSGRMVAQGKAYNGQMPGFRDRLSDDQIAAVLTHERSSFGNDAGPVSAEDVARVRAETADRGKAWTAGELDALPGGAEGR